MIVDQMEPATNAPNEPNQPNEPTNAVFISYRRADSAESSGRIYDRLVERFGEARVFKDVDSIQPGVAFADYIVDSISQSAVELVIIGPSWLTISSGWNRRRLDDPGDFVRLEIETALRAGVPVIPVLVMSAAMPPAQRLPDSLKRLVERNGIQVRPDPDFRRDMERVIAAVEYWMARPRPTPVISAPVPSVPSIAPAPLVSAPQNPATTPPAPTHPAGVPPAHPQSASAGTFSPPIKPPGAKPRAALAFRRYQPFIIIGGGALVVALLAVTLYTLGLMGHPGTTHLPAAAQTQTASAIAALGQIPTYSYGPTAPGSCDRGPLASEWMTVLEDQHVQCGNSKSVATGLANLEFQGNGGLAPGSTFSVTLEAFSGLSSADSVKINVVISSGESIYLQLFPNNQFSATFLRCCAYGNTPDLSHLALQAAPNGRRQVSITVIGASWNMTANGATLASQPFPSGYSAPTSPIERVEIDLTSGASVTLSDFTIAPA
jgi:hypothetical protein